MAIEGLCNKPVIEHSTNTSDAVEASVEALEILGLVQDRDQVTESVAGEFNRLMASNVTQNGELFIKLPRDVITLKSLIAASDNTRYAGNRTYPATLICDNLWTPQPGADRYAADELDNLTSDPYSGTYSPHARLALYNPESPADQLLHFLKMPFHEIHTKPKKPTQLQAVNEASKAFETEHPDLSMIPLSVKDIAMIALTRRIKGENMPLEHGIMRDATLRTVEKLYGPGGLQLSHNEYEVASIDYHEKLRLRYSLGKARCLEGVGLSVGPNNLTSEMFN
jgi:hypothetical protein